MGKRRVGAAKPKRSKEADKWIYTGSQYERWQKLKVKIGVTSDLHLLSMLLDSYIKSHVPDFYFPHTIPVTSPYAAATSTYTTETVTETVQGTDTSQSNIEIKMECDSDYDIATEETADTFDNSPEHSEAITDHHSDKQYNVNTDNTKQPKKRVRIYIEKIVVETNKDNEDGGDDIPAGADDCDAESNTDIPDIPDLNQASDEQSASVQESNNVSPKVQESNSESLATKDVHADSVDNSVRLDSDIVIKQETEDNGEYNAASAGPPSSQERVMESNSQEELRMSSEGENVEMDVEGIPDEPLDGSLLDVSINEVVVMTPSKPSRPECSECGKSFTTQFSLKRHKKSHEVGSIRCSGCHQYFQTEDDKAAHIRDKHTNHVCHVCGKSYKRPSDLNTHLKNHEENASAKFTCPFDGCSKTFVRRTVYQDHLNTHTGQEPYECQSCAAKFVSLYARNSHYKQCAGLTKIRCDICAQEFTHRSSLHHHRAAQHSDKSFTCGCGANFKYPGGLQRHKKCKGHF